MNFYSNNYHYLITQNFIGYYNPDDPDAKVGRTKDGAYDMIYKPEHTVDLETGAIIAAEARPGDAGDTVDLSSRIIEAVEFVEEMHGQDQVEGASRVRSVTADKGYHNPGELGIIQNETGARTVIGDAGAARRRPENLDPEARQAVGRAARGEKQKRQSASQNLKKRGMHIERGFAHVLDCGARRCGAWPTSIKDISAASSRSISA